jgi:mRNA interferase MazF
MPNENLVYKRGEIWWVNLEPTVGNEVGKQRPCIVLQNDVGNRHSATTIVAPLVRSRRQFPFLVRVEPTAQNGLDEARSINLSQLRVVDYQRFSNRLGRLEDRYWQSIEQAMMVEFGFSADFTD